MPVVCQKKDVLTALIPQRCGERKVDHVRAIISSGKESATTDVAQRQLHKTKTAADRNYFSRGEEGNKGKTDQTTRS